MTSRPEPDAQLVAAHDLARAALAEVTSATSIGDPVDYVLEDDGVVSLRFENRLAGYPGWLWTVSVARADDAEPTVLEVELLPAEGALLAPEWVPWAERLADYHAQQAATAASVADGELGDGLDDDDADDDIDDELDDVEDLDAADFDDDGSPILHAGDVDGVDIDELDESNDDDDELDEDAPDDDDDLDEDAPDDDDDLDEDAPDDDDDLDGSSEFEDDEDEDSAYDDESDEDDSAS